jgi:hypothetical protein
VAAVPSKIPVEEHPDRLTSHHALAIACLADGQIKKAVELLEHVVAVRSITIRLGTFTEEHSQLMFKKQPERLHQVQQTSAPPITSAPE